MNSWFDEFWQEDGSRILYSGAAFGIALFMHYVLELQAQAEVIFIGVGMLWFNKARGNGKVKP